MWWKDHLSSKNTFHSFTRKLEISVIVPSRVGAFIVMGISVGVFWSKKDKSNHKLFFSESF